MCFAFDIYVIVKKFVKLVKMLSNEKVVLFAHQRIASETRASFVIIVISLKTIQLQSNYFDQTINLELDINPCDVWDIFMKN